MSVRTSTLPKRTRPAAGASLAVTDAGTVHDEPAGRSAFASVTAIDPNDGVLKKTST